MEGNVRTREFSFLIEATLCADGNAPKEKGDLRFRLFKSNCM